MNSKYTKWSLSFLGDSVLRLYFTKDDQLVISNLFKFLERILSQLLIFHIPLHSCVPVCVLLNLALNLVLGSLLCHSCRWEGSSVRALDLVAEESVRPTVNQVMAAEAAVDLFTAGECSVIVSEENRENDCWLGKLRATGLNSCESWTVGKPCLNTVVLTCYSPGNLTKCYSHSIYIHLGFMESTILQGSFTSYVSNILTRKERGLEGAAGNALQSCCSLL